MKVAIIGAGLAGCATGYFLKKAGADVVIYETGSSIACGASGNDVGLCSPRFSAFKTPGSLFYTAAFRKALEIFSLFDDIDWMPEGVLHLIVNEKRERQYRQTVENWGWREEDLRIIDAQEASGVAGVDIPYDALYLPQSGRVSPRKLCIALAAGIDVRLNVLVEDLQALKVDRVILCNGMGATQFIPLPLRGVRGQVTSVRATELSKRLKTNLSYGRYFSMARDGTHMVGATFQRWLDHSDILPEDDDYNIDQLRLCLPDLAEGLEVIGHRAAIRTASPDYFPMIGHVRDHIYVSTAHGSHGILTSIGGGALLAEMIVEQSVSQSDATIAALCPLRFKHAKKMA